MSFAGVEAGQLRAVVALWKRERRRFQARFGGRSMEPAIHAGDLLDVACGEAIGRGNVVVLLADGRVVVHRVAALYESDGWILTRGDAAALPDLPSRVSDVIGLVEGVHEGSSVRPVAPGPESLARRAALAFSRWPMPRRPALCRAILRILWTARRILFAYPAAAMSRLRGSGAAPVEQEDHAEAAQEARQ